MDGQAPTLTPMLNVAPIPSPTCLLNLPLSLHRREPPLVLLCVPIGADNSSGFVAGWGGGASSRADAVEVPAALAEALGLKPGLQVRIHIVELPRVSSLWVCPESQADWVIAQREADVLTNDVLRQVFAAKVGQRLPLWVRGSECIWVRVLRSEPEAPAVRLAAGMDLIVAPPTENGDSSDAQANGEPTPRRLLVTRRLRVGSHEVGGSFSIGLAGTTMRRLGAREGELLLLKASAGAGGSSSTMLAPRRANPPAYCFGYATVLTEAPDGHVMLPLQLRRLLGREVGTTIRVKALDIASTEAVQPERVAVHLLDANPVPLPLSSPSAERVAEALDEWLGGHAAAKCSSGLPLPQGAVLQLPRVGRVQLHFDPPAADAKPTGFPGAAAQGAGASPAAPYVLMADWAREAGGSSALSVGPRKGWAPHVAGSVSPLTAELRLLPSELDEAVASPIVLGGRQQELDSAVRHATGALHAIAAGQARGALMGLLLTGPRGVGKTALAEALAARLREAPVPTWTATVPANALLALRQPTAILARLRAMLQRACACAPSVLILEDLNKVFASAAAEPDNSATLFAESAAEMLGAHAFAAHRPPVVIVATAPSADKLHGGLRVLGLLDWELRLAMPDRASRLRTLSSLTRQLRVSAPEAALDWAASATEGLVAAELRHLLSGAQLAAAARRLLPAEGGSAALPGEKASARLQLCEADLREALPHVTSAVRASGGATPGASSSAAGGWADVGGLEEVKRVLHESVLLPRDHPELFASAPLRLTSGALLYGHAGCGKTFLAAALAGEAGLPFLTVKGPELLNKYIGASEAAVRELFARAASCQPCILFFDEFEAIAPRRGQDSTGVTDRVVNQLLCELDGIESLHGVFVLAASNRPELIDPALLRPGRLDRKLYCPLPDLNARTTILGTLLSKVRVEPQLQSAAAQRALAMRCDGYSGADLSALLTNAQLAAVHEALDAVAAEPTRERVCIRQKHVEEAFQTTRPSNSPASLSEREAAFTRFASGEEAVKAAGQMPLFAQRIVHA